jgi:hypothetical protein
VEWIDLDKVMEKWQALVDTIYQKTFGLHKMFGNPLVAERLVPTQVGLNSIELV